MGDQPQGTGTPQVPQGDEPEFVTKTDFDTMVNRAITSRFTEFTKKHNAVLDDKFSGFEKKLTDFLPKPPEPGTQPNTDDKSIENHPLFKGMAKKLGDVEERLRLSDERVSAEQKRTKDLSLRQHVGEALAKANVKDATRAKHAASFLIREGLAKWDEAGDELVFVDGSNGDVDFETGFKAWLKTDDAKLYLPSPDAAAPPGRQQQQRVSPNGGPPPNLSTLSFEDKLALTAQQLEKQGVGF